MTTPPARPRAVRVAWAALHLHWSPEVNATQTTQSVAPPARPASSSPAAHVYVRGERDEAHAGRDSSRGACYVLPGSVRLPRRDELEQ